MAWSDAARAAALATRRMHAHYKKQANETKSLRFISAPTTKTQRKEIAHNLKLLRRGNFGYGEASRHELLANAAYSTRLRNAARISRRKK